MKISSLSTGMNAAVRATVRVGLYCGAKVYFVHEVNTYVFFLLEPLINTEGCRMYKAKQWNFLRFNLMLRHLDV